jgi:hypothetical protein
MLYEDVEELCCILLAPKNCKSLKGLIYDEQEALMLLMDKVDDKYSFLVGKLNEFIMNLHV